MKLSHRSFSMAALGLCSLSLLINQVMASLYFHEDLFSTIFFGALGALIFLISIGYILSLVPKLGPLLLKSYLLSLFLLNLLNITFIFFPPKQLFSFWEKLIIFIGFLIATGFVSIFLSNNYWNRIINAFMVFGFIMCLLPIVPFFHNSPVRLNTFNVDKFKILGVDNYVVVVLDELSPEYSEKIIVGLNKTNVNIKVTEVQAAAGSTLISIPTMLTNENLSDATICGVDTLCGANQFDYSALHTNQSNTDVIGFHTPYCSIQGLRSCIAYLNIFGKKTVSTYALTLICNQFDKFNLLSFCKPEDSKFGEIRKVRNEFIGDVFHAPFWRDGGVYYIHAPLPHPSMVPSNNSLKQEYEENIVMAGKFIDDLNLQLSKRFDKNYLLVITSDHPLRVDYWCQTKPYRSSTCSMDLPKNRMNVPLIIVSPQKISIKNIETNKGLLTPYQ